MRVLQRGKIGLFAGTVSSFRGRRQLVHPEYELLPVEAVDAETTAEAAAEYATELIPVYPASARLSSWHISKAVEVVLNTLDIGEDPLPEDVRQQHDLWPREMAIRAIHRPQDRSDLQRARKRLKWDEAFVMQAALAQRRHRRRRDARDATAAGAGRDRGGVRPAPAVHADRGAAVRRRGHRPRPVVRVPDEPAAAGRGRLGEDRRRGAGHAPGGGRRRAGRAARPHRGARAAALPVDHRAARAARLRRAARRRGARHPGGAADRLDRRTGAALRAVGRVHR